MGSGYGPLQSPTRRVCIGSFQFFLKTNTLQWCKKLNSEISALGDNAALWQDANKTISETTELFVIEGIRGGSNLYAGVNDIAIDNLSVKRKECGCKLHTS